jgi:arsenate reductase (thioredoxin)
MKILIACTGNSCRSPMSEGFLESLDHRLMVFSAGSLPEKAVSPYAIYVMKEILLDISQHAPKAIESFANEQFDLIICLSEQALLDCRRIFDAHSELIHLEIEDPIAAKGNEMEIINAYRNSRDKIKNEFFKLYVSRMKNFLR